MGDRLMCASLLSTNFHALHMPLLLLICFLDNCQVLCGKRNLNPSLIRVHISGAINDSNKCHSLRATVSMTNSKGKPSCIFPLKNDK